MKKLFASMLVVLSVFFVGNTANAAPWVNLGYYDGAQCRVDKGSYVIGGTINYTIIIAIINFKNICHTIYLFKIFATRPLASIGTVIASKGIYNFFIA